MIEGGGGEGREGGTGRCPARQTGTSFAGELRSVLVVKVTANPHAGFKYSWRMLDSVTSLSRLRQRLKLPECWDSNGKARTKDKRTEGEVLSRCDRQTRSPCEEQARCVIMEAETKGSQGTGLERYGVYKYV
jgi:hypothetical protein